MNAASTATQSVGGGRLALVATLNLLITAAEVIGGLLSGSLSLLSDALHNLSDAVALLITWVALVLQRRPRSDRHTFGLKRAEVLAAVINAGTLVAISLYLFAEAWQRWQHPEPIAGGVMAAVAGVGLVANVLGTWLLRRGAGESMNLRAAYLHLLSDALSSVGVVVGGLAITFLGVVWVDPLLTVLIGLYVLKESLEILWRALGMFMLAAPAGMSLDAVRRAVLDVPGVLGVHHLHLWEVSERDAHLEAHVVLANQPVSEAAGVRQAIQQAMAGQFGLTHCTLQFEDAGTVCPSADLP